MSTAREKILSAPAASPPPGVTPNFEHPSEFEKSGFIVAITLLVIITLLFSMRMFVKTRIARHIAIEDYLLALAYLIYSGGFTVVAILVARKHVGAHQWNLTVRQLIDYLKTFHVGSVLYNVIILPLKVSITLQVLRFFVPPGTRNFTFWMSHALIWLNVVFYITCTFLLIFACKPESKQYDPTVKEGHCLDTAAILISTAVLNTVSDGLMLVLPQRVIWDLTMPIKRKLGLSAAFFVALLAFASSLVRLFFATRLKTSHDMSYNIGWLGMWTLPEIAIGFFIACLPFVPKFMKYVARKPAIARIVDRMAVEFRQSFGKTRHYKKTGDYPVVTQIPRPRHASRLISDVEFDELVARTGLSSIEGRPELENHRPVMWARHGDQHDGRHLDATDPAQWRPVKDNAHGAAVWTSKDLGTQTTLVPEPGGIIVTTNVSVSRE